MLIRLKPYSKVAPNHAYLDEAASLKSAAWLIESGDFDYATFAELCNLLEAIVLYDHLYTAPISYISSPTPRVDILSPLLKHLVTEGVLTYLQPLIDLLCEDAPLTPEVERYRNGIKVFEEAKKGKGILHIEHLNGVGMASVYGMHVHPSISNEKAYLNLLSIYQATHITNAIVEAYNQMSGAIGRDIEKLMKARGRTYVPIPPLALEIMKRVSKPDEIVEETLTLRHKFKGIRDAYADYANDISNDELPLKKSLSAQIKLRTVLAELSKPFGSAEGRRLLEWSDVGDVVEAVSEVSVGDPTSLVKLLLGKPIDWLVHKLSRRKFMQLYRLRRQTLRTAGYEKQISRLWGKAVQFADDPPARLHEIVDYPLGSSWRIYSFEDLRLWSWNGRWVGFCRDDNLVSPDHRHVGRFVGDEVYSINGNYLGEWRQGRLLSVRSNRHKVVSLAERLKCEGGPVNWQALKPRPLPEGCDDFPEI